MTTTYERDGNGRLTNTRTTNTAGIVQEFSYTYDAANNIKSRNNNQYAYDELNRLAGAKVEGNFHDDYPAKKGYITEDFFGQKFLDFAMDPASRVKLDYAGASVGVDMGLSVQNIDRITLRRDITGNGPQNRSRPSTFDVYYQNGAGDFVKVDPADWEMRDDGRGAYTVFLKKPVEARVVKVRSKYNDRGEDMAPVDKATFTNSLEKTIDVQPKVNEAFLQYEYDTAGNRTAQYFTVVLTHETHYQYYANSNRLLTNGKWAYVYDANGNLIKKGNQYQIIGEQVTFTTEGPFAELWEYGYDLLNRLATVKKNGTQVSSYVYDPTGLRVAKHGSKGDTDYTFDLGGNAIYEKDIATGKERSYVWVGGQHFARVDGGIGGTAQKYFYHTDHEGSLTAVTDGTGVVLWRSDTLPFGGKIEQDKEYAFSETHGFTGKEWDEDTGLYYFNARWYDSELGRFITEDSVVDPNNPNLYVYGANNPLRFTDPTGHWNEESVWNKPWTWFYSPNVSLKNTVNGVQGDQKVIKAQGYLSIMGFPVGDFGPNKNGVDAQMGSRTKAATKAFQKMVGLEPTGELDDATLSLMSLKANLEYTERDLAKLASQRGVNLEISSDSTRADFVNAVYYNALLDEEKTGVPAAITTAQAILETGYGKHVPTDINTGQYSYNLFGIKALYEEGPAGHVSAWTEEEDKDTNVHTRVIADFKAYHSFGESIYGRSSDLQKWPNYRSLFESNDPIKWAKGLKVAGYATEKMYDILLINIIKSEGLK